MDAFTSGLVHAAITVAVQLALWLLTGNVWAGGAAMSLYFFGREHAQHLYKVANRKGVSVKRLAWYEGLNPFAWNEDGFADVALPVVAMLITAAVLE